MSQTKLEFGRGSTIAAKYEVVDKLQESPLGATYRVKHIKSGKYVRLTLLNPRIASREQKESVIASFKTARELAKTGNAMRVGELYEHEGVAYYTTEDFEGKTLREVLQEYKIAGKKFSVREAAQITIQILEALTPLHDRGGVHRALRPENILIRLRRTGPRGANLVATARVTGLGWFDLVPTGSLAEDEFSRGEAQYLAPELKSFDPSPTERSDIYSAGVIFYELLVGAAPVGTFQLPRQVRSDLPNHVDNVIELALAYAPEDRYPTVRDFIADVQRTFQAVRNEGVTPESSLHPMVWVLSFALVGAVAVILFSQNTDPTDELQRKDQELRTQVKDSHSKPSPDEVTKILKRHPPNMAYVPEGPYVKGKLNIESMYLKTPGPGPEIAELPGFMIDMFEYPNQLGAPPKTGITWIEAKSLCEAGGKRLCTADEWEKACKGPPNYAYGYGDTFDQDFCGKGARDTHRSGDRQDCKSLWGVYDMAGNFVELTADAPKGDKGRRLVKGGSLGSANEASSRCAASTDVSESYAPPALSFRCCRGVDDPPMPPELPKTP